MKILYIGAHPDDIEVGAGGTVAKQVSEGNEVWFYVMGDCSSNNGLGFTGEVLRDEAYRAALALGVKFLKIENYPNTRYPEYSYQIRTDIEKIQKQFRPDAVFFPSEYDLHQDHYTVAMETQRAFRGGEELYAFETGSTRHDFNPNLFINIEKFIDLKESVLELYKTQAARPYFKNNDWLSVAQFRALKSNYYVRGPVEAFQQIRRFIK
jgi:LmbE family N-acetylglucosaminyl deacetylase